MLPRPADDPQPSETGAEPMLSGAPSVACRYSRDDRGFITVATAPHDPILEGFLRDIGGRFAIDHLLGVLESVGPNGTARLTGSNVHAVAILTDRVEIEFDYGGRTALSRSAFRECLLEKLRFLESES
jgi:hypothetical protein